MERLWIISSALVGRNLQPLMEHQVLLVLNSNLALDTPMDGEP